MSADILPLLVRATLALSAGIVLVLLLRAPLRQAFGARVAYAFWLAAPMAMVAALLPPRRVVVETVVQAPQMVATGLSPETAVTGATAEAASIPPLDLAPLVIGIWLLGALGSFALLAAAHARFNARLNLRRVERGVHIAANACAGPAVVGVIAPRIVIPADFATRYSVLEQNLVLEHERAHMRAGDVQINALAALMQCLFWFNPLIYAARAALRIDQELACDERVMQRHAGARRAYAEAMLKTQLAAHAVPLGCAWPPVGARPLKQRIAMLARPAAAAPRRLAGALLCGLTILFTGLAAWAAQPARVAYAETSTESDRDNDNWLLQRSAGARLVEALMRGDLPEARALIRTGADVDHWTPGDGTPLIMAARLNDAEMARELIAEGADVNKPARGEGNPLIVASMQGHLALVQLFVEQGADVNAIVAADETPLINAARHGHVEVARYLIAHGADVNLAVQAPTVRGVERRSPLSMAQRGGHTEMVALLRSAGARN